MKTVMPSPARAAGLLRHRSSPRGLRESDWIGFNCGDTVTEVDGRHSGRVEAVHHGAYVKVRWHDTGWFSDVPRNQLVKVKG